MNIGYWAWELEHFPPKWVRHVTSYHEIWTPSDFVTQAVYGAIRRDNASIATQVTTMPFGLRVDAESYSADRSLFDLPENAFVFLVVFDYFSCIERKNPIGAIQAFLKAFPERENQEVFLIVKSMNVQFASAADFVTAHLPMMELTRDYHNIRHIQYHLSGATLKTLKASVDCLVSLHRSEGYGLNLLEFMMLGKPVIATAYR